MARRLQLNFIFTDFVFFVELNENNMRRKEEFCSILWEETICVSVCVCLLTMDRQVFVLVNDLAGNLLSIRDLCALCSFSPDLFTRLYYILICTQKLDCEILPADPFGAPPLPLIRKANRWTRRLLLNPINGIWRRSTTRVVVSDMEKRTYKLIRTI